MHRIEPALLSKLVFRLVLTEYELVTKAAWILTEHSGLVQLPIAAELIEIGDQQE